MNNFASENQISIVVLHRGTDSHLNHDRNSFGSSYRHTPKEYNEVSMFSLKLVLILASFNKALRHGRKAKLRGFL